MLAPYRQSAGADHGETTTEVGGTPELDASADYTLRLTLTGYVATLDGATIKLPLAPQPPASSN